MRAITDIYSAMQTGTPYKTYKKTILGKVYVSAIDPFSDQPVGIMLYGDPKKNEQTAFIDMWSERDDVFFKRMNQVHFKNGTLIETTRKVETVPEKSFEQASDEELKELFKLKFLAFTNKLNKIESTAVLFRLLGIAEDLEKSDAIMRAIKGRLAELGAPIPEEEE